MSDAMDQRIPKKIQTFLRSAMDAIDLLTTPSSITYIVTNPLPRSRIDWEITLHVALLEIYRGKDDGARVLPGFKVDLQAICRLFDPLSGGKGWKKRFSLEHLGGEKPKIVFCGKVGGELIALEILTFPPADEEPEYTLDSVTGKITRRK